MGSRDRGGSTTHQNRPSWSKVGESNDYVGLCAAKHHVYFYVDGSLMNDISAVRMQDGYNHYLAFLKDGDGLI
jgi:hypothetical protein